MSPLTFIAIFAICDDLPFDIEFGDDVGLMTPVRYDGSGNSGNVSEKRKRKEENSEHHHGCSLGQRTDTFYI